MVGRFDSDMQKRMLSYLYSLVMGEPASENAGFSSLLRAASNPYSYLFDAQAGALDHAIVSSTLAPQVVETMEWHINADEPGLLDYNLEFGRDPALFDATIPYRASDHDPIVVGLDLDN